MTITSSLFNVWWRWKAKDVVLADDQKIDELKLALEEEVKFFCKVVNLDFWYAMGLLDHLHNNKKCKESGQNVSEERIEFSFELKRRKKGKTATQGKEPPAETKKVITILHLSPQRTQKLLDFLEQNEQIIRGRGLSRMNIIGE